jgi:hypothetical protein
MKLTKLALACALTGALVACGGGSSNPTIAGGVGTTRTLAGIAAKGLIKNGIVEVFSYDAAGKKSAQPLVTTRTSTDGSYSVNLGNNIGLFTIEVSADAATTMADEISHKDIAMPLGMTLRSVVQLDSAASTAIKGYVTPFTDMLVNAAINANGGLTASNVATAQSAVIALLKFDPLGTKPVNIESAAATTDAAEQAQSLMLAAISKLANDGSLGCTQATVSEKIKCAVTATTGSASLKDGALSLPNQSTFYTAAAAVFADPTVNKTTAVSLESIGITQGSAFTAPVVPVIENPVAAAKALFASLRTNIQAWSDAFSGGDAAKSLNTIKANFDAAIAPVDQDLADWVLISDKGTRFYQKFKAGNVTTFPARPAVLRNGMEVGRCFLYTDADSNNEATASSDVIDNVSCRLTRVRISNVPLKEFTKAIKLTPTVGSTTNFSYTARARLETNGVPVTTGSAGTGTISFEKSGSTTTNITIAGDMPARTNNMGEAITDKETWNVNFVRTLEADNITTKYVASGGITAYWNSVAISSITLKSGSFIRAIDQAPQEVQLLLDVASNGSKVAGTLYLGGPQPDKLGQNIIPTIVRFTGSFSNGGTEFFNGVLFSSVYNYATYDRNAVDSTTNFLKASISFDGIAKIPNRPELKLILNVSNPVFGTEAFYGEYNDGTNKIFINATDATGEKVIKVLTTNGVSMQFGAGAQKIDIMKNNSIVAYFDQSTGMINYADGTGESLK